MKIQNTFITILSGIILISGCTEENISTEEQKGLEVTGITVTLDNTDKGEVTRSVDDYAANTNQDPTAKIEGRTGWILDLEIYNGDSSYTDGEASFIQQSDDSWSTSDYLYFPDYKNQKYSAIVYHQDWNITDNDQTVDTDQNSGPKLLKQDILTHNTSYRITPAKIPVVKVEHNHSMLNFRLGEINTNTILSVEVLAGDTYKPFKVKDGEYMVILPVGISYPIISLTTAAGINYQQMVKIDETKKNECYCFTLNGIELLISPVIVKNWSTGEAISGENTAVTAYPTFRGPEYSSCRLYFKNGLTQDITFNSQGEWTGKPVGRTITEVRVLETINNEIVETKIYILPVPKALRDMIINLTNYIALATPIQ